MVADSTECVSTEGKPPIGAVIATLLLADGSELPLGSFEAQFGLSDTHVGVQAT